MYGQAARDAAYHFVQRWNFIKVDKGAWQAASMWFWGRVRRALTAGERWLTPTRPGAAAKTEPNIPFLLPVADEDTEQDAAIGIAPRPYTVDDGGENILVRPPPTCETQLLRSASRWSSGITRENSIYQAYIASTARPRWQRDEGRRQA